VLPEPERPNAPLISVVVPAHNSAATIGQCLSALQQQTIDNACYEVIVVDDGSTDETAEIARRCGARVVCQDRGRPAAARNAGIRDARGELVCFTDADCEPTESWLSEVTAPFANHEIVGSKGIYATRQQALVARFVQIEYEDKYDLLLGQEYIDFIDTYSAAYRRDVLIANNGFDESFPYLEDQELSFRLATRGYRMVFQPGAVVYHRHAATLLDYLHKKFIIGFWKAQVVRRFPERGVRDSHTPQVMKVQLALMAAALLSAAGILFTGWSAILLALFLLLFLATTVPFVRKAWKKDRAVAIAAPLLLGVRALGLGFGYAWGTLRPRPGISGTQSTIGGFNYIAKRTLDVIVALLGLCFTIMVGPLITIAIKLDSPGPVLFRQERVGQGGKRFTIYKFRSMHAGAEEELDELLALEELEEPVFKLANDPRRTRVGKFLRRWSLDELPQFWNVFKGDMSLVGPRPEEARVVAFYTDWHRRRLSIKPGLTGPMQINGRGDLSLDERVRLELDYIENYSLWRDAKILLRTLPAVLRGDGAH
ncbi:MAG TPA: sugar transferase, partial [Candidatus Sulfomarinibacteraceae bacterium]|nr:sugar transferase [Candidatus Sulfomarinibacteraceae bacterium]